jgi:hypothetical protein
MARHRIPVNPARTSHGTVVDVTSPQVRELDVFLDKGPYIHDETDRRGLERALEDLLVLGISRGVLRGERDLQLARLMFRAGAGFGYVRGSIAERRRAAEEAARATCQAFSGLEPANETTPKEAQ